MLLEKVKVNLANAGYYGSLLKPNDLLLAVDRAGKIMNNRSGEPEVILCNFELVWKISDTKNKQGGSLSSWNGQAVPSASEG